MFGFATVLHILFVHFSHASTTAQGRKESFPFLHDVRLSLLLRLTVSIFLLSPQLFLCVPSFSYGSWFSEGVCGLASSENIPKYSPLSSE